MLFTKEIILPYKCTETGLILDTTSKLSAHIKYKLKMDIELFYNLNIDNTFLKCFFCNNKGRFISSVKGYKNLCNDKECVSRSRATSSIDGIMYKYNYTLEQAKQFKENSDKHRSLKNIEYTKNKIIKNPDYTKENSNWCKEYWLKRGFTEDYAIETIKKNQTLLSKKKKRHRSNASLSFWLDKGFSESEAKKKISKIQTTFSKKICIEKHGEIKGLEIWQNRQDKWQNTMNKKSDEEKKEINRKRLMNFSGFSKISQKLFDKIYLLFEQKTNKILYESLNTEFFLNDSKNNKFYLYDYVDRTTKKIIEFHGDFWHANPNKYDKDYYNTVTKLTAQEMWEKDKIKISFAKSKGYDVLIIWESDYNKNEELIIKKCLNFLN